MDWITEKYKIKIDVFNRVATNFNYKLAELKTSVFIINSERIINAKSLLGLLSLKLTKDSIIEVRFDGKDEAEKLKEIFSEIADKI